MGIDKLNLDEKFVAVSFSIGKRRNYKTTDLIIDLLNKSIQEQAAITNRDIHLLYWIYKTEGESKQLPPSNEWVQGYGWKVISMDKQTFINHWRMQRNAISWFKGGLSSAIIDGKILVLPIINI